MKNDFRKPSQLGFLPGIKENVGRVFSTGIRNAEKMRKRKKRTFKILKVRSG